MTTPVEIFGDFFNVPVFQIRDQISAGRFAAGSKRFCGGRVVVFLISDLITFLVKVSSVNNVRRVLVGNVYRFLERRWVRGATIAWGPISIFWLVPPAVLAWIVLTLKYRIAGLRCFAGAMVFAHGVFLLSARLSPGVTTADWALRLPCRWVSNREMVSAGLVAAAVGAGLIHGMRALTLRRSGERLMTTATTSWGCPGALNIADSAAGSCTTIENRLLAGGNRNRSFAVGRS